MVQEFRNFGMNIVSISETKWFGQSVYDVDGFLILHSGHPVPEVMRGSSVQLMAVREELSMPPSEDETFAAMSSLKVGKAGGKMVCCQRC